MHAVFKFVKLKNFKRHKIVAVLHYLRHILPSLSRFHCYVCYYVYNNIDSLGVFNFKILQKVFLFNHFFELSMFINKKKLYSFPQLFFKQFKWIFFKQFKWIFFTSILENINSMVKISISILLPYKFHTRNITICFYIRKVWKQFSSSHTLQALYLTRVAARTCSSSYVHRRLYARYFSAYA